MPSLPAASPLSDHVVRAAAATNSTADPALRVVCAWPVSGQYGPGSRVLYYVLVAACVFARKAEWLRKACLAAALLFPAVAAIHGIVLAAENSSANAAVDMDIYGAFQFCSIGILAAPLTVRLSRTYFFDRGRNIIFFWTGLILAGLMSLTVEFYRASSQQCAHDGNSTVSYSVDDFPYGQATCGIPCAEDTGQVSPLRGGSSNESWVIPAPDKLTFNTAMLLAAGCCIPAFLSLVLTWEKILEINWRTRFGDSDARMNELIEGTNGATIGQMKGINDMVRFLLSVIEIPVFCAAVLAILVIGESNLFSRQVRYETEPIASVGQWAPIAGTVLAALGSLYLLLAGEEDGSVSHHAKTSCSPSHHSQTGAEPSPMLNVPNNLEQWPTDRSSHGDISRPYRSSHEASPAGDNRSIHPTRRDRANTASTVDFGSRRKVAKWLTSAGNHLGTAAHAQFDLSEFNRSRARHYPEIPGERIRNPDLPEVTRQYSQRRDAVLREQNSRIWSSAASMASNTAVDEPPATPKSNASSPPPVETGERGRAPKRRDTLEVPSPTHNRVLNFGMDELQASPKSIASSPPPADSSERGRAPKRRDTLEVPSPTHRRLPNIVTDKPSDASKSTTSSSPPTESRDKNGTPRRRNTLEVPSPTHPRP